jgi:hypothetical protein
VNKTKHTADTVFALLLFCAFAVSMLIVLTIGVRAYQGVRDSVENNYSQDTCVSYITTKIRHADETGGSVYLGDYCGIPALFTAENFDDTAYLTAIYFYDGYVKEFSALAELFTDTNNPVEPDFGFDILPVTALTFEMTEENLLHITCVGTSKKAEQVYLHLRAGGQ